MSFGMLVMGTLAVLMALAFLWGLCVLKHVRENLTTDCTVCGEHTLRKRTPEKWRCSKCGCIVFDRDLDRQS